MKFRNQFFTQFAVLFAVFLLFEGANLMFDAYPSNLWYSPVHFVAGIWLAFFFRWIFAEFGVTFNLSSSLALVFLVGFLWEAWEYVIGAIDFPATYYIDTFSDLALDILGGLLGFFLGSAKKEGDILQIR